MTTTDELYLILRAKKGDKDATQKLINSYESLLNLFLMPYHHEDRKDLKQDMMVAFLETIQKFDPSRASRLRKLLRFQFRLCIIKFILNSGIVRRTYEKRNTERFSYESVLDHHAIVTTAPEEGINTSQIASQVAKVVKLFPTRDQFIINNLYLKEDVNNVIIADQLKISRERVRQIRQRLDKRLKKDLKPVWQNLRISA